MYIFIPYTATVTVERRPHWKISGYIDRYTWLATCMKYVQGGKASVGARSVVDVLSA
jgi:hypothetical protein